MGIFTQSEQDLINNQITNRLIFWFRSGLFPALGPFETPRRIKDQLSRIVSTTPDTAVDQDFCLIKNAFAVNYIENLPPAANRQMLILVDNSDSGTWQIEASGGDSINLTGSVKMTGNGEYLVLLGDGGTNWMIVAHGFAMGTLSPFASGLATLVNGMVTVNTPLAKVGMKVLLSPQDLNSLGYARLDPSTIVAGVSFGINSTGATDTGIILWVIQQ